MRVFLKTSAIVIAIAPIIIAAYLYFRTATPSLAVVAPGGQWILALPFIVPAAIAALLWRIADSVR